MNKREERYAKKAEELWAFDAEYQGVFGAICGMDEAGRGPLAGPVYAACVAFFPDHEPILRVNDSKKIPEGIREELDVKIRTQCIGHGIGQASVEEIAQYNILGATRLAMKRAYAQMDLKYYMLLDGMEPNALSLVGEGIIKGDGQSYHIAAASILAKVARDREMKRLDVKYPGYGFAQHKGYGTLAHREALLSLGPCAIHRLDFLKGILG